MQKKRRKLICFGGKRYSGVIRLYGGTLVPINYGKMLTYLMVSAIAIAIVMAAIFGSGPKGKSTTVEADVGLQEPKAMVKSVATRPSVTTKPLEGKNEVAKETETAELEQREEPEAKLDTASDFLIEVISNKNKQKVEALVLAKLQEEQAQDHQTELQKQQEPTSALVVHEEKSEAANSYVAAFAAGTEERIRIAMDIIIKNGFTPEAAAGMIGNALVESQLKTDVSNGYYYGVFQWNSGWWTNIKNWLTENGYDVYSFEGHIHAAVECPHWGCMSEKRWATLKELTNIDQATELFAVFYEGCIGGSDPTEYYSVGTNYQCLNLRKSEAIQALKVYNGGEYTGSKPYYP